MFTIEDFKAGQRVQLHPATDLWMQGARYGDVVQVGRLVLIVKLDSGREVRVTPHNIGEIVQ